MILILIIGSIAGSIFVAMGKPLAANYIWSVANIGILWHNYQIGEYELVMLFATCEIIALYGIWNLKIRPWLKARN